jgi:dTMP kinase
MILVTFEGTEGCGKSTLIRNLSEQLKQRSISHISTREPGGSPVAESIRSIILNQDMHPMTELFLYEAARVEHYKNVIEPALKQKKIVLCDRFTDSTVAYQGAARGIDQKVIRYFNQQATLGRQPDLTFFLDLPVKEGLARAQDPNRFEREGLGFQTEVRKGFLKLMGNVHPGTKKGRWVRLVVSKKSPEQVCEQALQFLIKKLQK